MWKLLVANVCVSAAMFFGIHCSTAHADWTIEYGNSVSNVSNGVVIDSVGNSFTSGFTSSTGGFKFLGQTPSGSNDGYVAKRDSSGNLLWAGLLGTSSNEQVFGLATVGGSNVAIGGFTAGSFPTYTLSGSSDAVVRLYDGSGSTLWTRQYGTTGSDEIRGLASNSLGHIYATGSTSGAFAGFTAAGNQDGFVSQLDATTGAVNWTYQFGTQPNDVSYSAATDAAGNVYITGTAAGTLLGQSWSGGTDTFALKLDVSGNLVWAKLFGGAANDEARSIALDSTGAIYIGGYTTGTLPGETSAGDNDAFVLKLDISGNLVWTRQFGTSGTDFGYAVAVDANDHLILTGATNGALPGETNAGNFDGFFRVYDTDGSVLFTDQFGSTADDFSQGAATDSTGAIYLAGVTSGALPGQTFAGASDAFEIQTVPEPGSMGLFGVGLLGLAMWRRRA
jgi:hypothetical protein